MLNTKMKTENTPSKVTIIDRNPNDNKITINVSSHSGTKIIEANVVSTAVASAIHRANK